MTDVYKLLLHFCYVMTCHCVPKESSVCQCAWTCKHDAVLFLFQVYCFICEHIELQDIYFMFYMDSFCSFYLLAQLTVKICPGRIMTGIIIKTKPTVEL